MLGMSDLRSASPVRPLRPVGVEFFAGAGGLSLGFEQAGFDVAAAVEIDPVHCGVHALNFPHTPVLCRDVRTLSGADVRLAAGLGKRDIDVVFGGPPCQGFSLQGQRLLDDPRNHLVQHFLRLALELRPKYVVMENVPGMASGQHHLLLDELVRGFVAGGYQVRTPHRILNAAEYGVPQARRRLFLLCARDGLPVPAYPDPVTRVRSAARPGARRGLPADSAPSGLPDGPGVADAIGDLPVLEERPELFSTDVLEGPAGSGAAPASVYARGLRGEAVDASDFSFPRRHDRSRLTGCRRAAHSEASQRRFAATLPGSSDAVSRFLRLDPDGLCNTLRAGTNTDHGAYTAPRPIHPFVPRCITVREAARLHSFPDWFRFHTTIWHGFRQVGNAVPPRLGRAVAAEVMAVLGGVPARPLDVLTLGEEAAAWWSTGQAEAAWGVTKVIAPRTRTPRRAAVQNSGG